MTRTIQTIGVALAVIVAFRAEPGLAAQSPFGVGIADQGGGFLPWVGQLQKGFYRDLTGAMKQLTESGAAFWWLASLSFIYGIAHAAGPGHGKVVISSYLLASEESLRRGIVIAFFAAMAQALAAIAIVGVVAVALRATSFTMTATQRVLEIGSYGLIAALGLFLLWRKVSGIFRRTATAAPGRHRQGHADGSRDECGHVHVPTPDTAARAGSVGGALAAVLSVGVRPCSGALIVLVFALSQGIFWAGVASTVLMGLGTALTVGVLATLAVGAKGLAVRLSGSDTALAINVMAGLELAAAMAITALGLVLLGGALSV